MPPPAGKSFMQPKSPGTKPNYLFFFLAYLLIVGGWFFLKPRLFPQPANEAQLHAVGRAFTPPLAGGLGEGLAGVVRLGLGSDRAISDFGTALALKPPPPKPVAPPPPVEPVSPPVKVEPVALGGPGFAITATLSPRGAGVRRLTLTQFRQADRLGLAVTENGDPKPLDLLPDLGVASFEVFHYDDATPDNTKPLDTLGRAVWAVDEKTTAADADRHSVTFSTTLSAHGVKLSKTFTLGRKEYHVGLTVRVERLANAPAGAAPFRYQLAGGRGLPVEGEWYTTTFRNALVGWVDDQGTDWRTLKDARVLGKEGGSERFDRVGKQVQYAAMAVQYFASAVVVDDRDKAGNPLAAKDRNFVEFVRATLESLPDATKPQYADSTVRLIAAPLDLAPGQAAEHQYLLYHGPVKVRLLHQLKGDAAVADELVDRYEETLHLRTLTDYGNFGIWTRVLIVMTNVMHRLLGTLQSVIPNDGLAIICLTLIVRMLMFPLSRKQAANMSAMQEKMAKVQPEVKKLEEKYKDDPMGKMTAQQALYRQHNINPAAGLGGCLMVFVQMPIFMGLYYALQENVFFRLQPFLWVRNLTAPDMLFGWGEGIPVVSVPEAQGGMLYLGPYLNLLPLVGAGLMFVQQKMTMPPPADEQAEMQQKMMKYMVVMMAFMFYKVPAGLSLYFITSSLWGLTERLLIKRAAAAKKAAEGGDEGPGVVVSAKGKPGGGGGKNGRKKDKEPEKPKGWLAERWEELLREASKK